MTLEPPTNGYRHHPDFQKEGAEAFGGSRYMNYSKETGCPNVHNRRCCRRPHPNRKKDAARRKGRIRLQKIDALISTGAAL